MRPAFHGERIAAYARVRAGRAAAMAEGWAPPEGRTAARRDAETAGPVADAGAAATAVV